MRKLAGWVKVVMGLLQVKYAENTDAGIQIVN